jgi:hypothetical protein
VTVADTGRADREAVLHYLYEQLVGPVGGPTEVLREKAPQDRYLTAVLFARPNEFADPQSAGADLERLSESSGVDAAEEIDELAGALPGDEGDDPVTLSGQNRPSSAGLSFTTDRSTAVLVEITAAVYRAAPEGGWRREPLDLVGADAVLVEPPATGRRASVGLWDGRATLEVVWRAHRGGVVVTVVLVNQRIQPERTGVRPEDCLFQIELRCSLPGADIKSYPPARQTHTDEEAEELELLYRDVPVFAIGHGAAADWDLSSAPPAWVGTSFLPMHVVPDIAFDLPGAGPVLELEHLAEIDGRSESICAELNAFVDGYAEWITETWSDGSGTVPEHLGPAAERLRGRAADARDRMRAGVALLAEDADARRAFGLANRAMAMQMLHSTKELGGSAHAPSDAPDPGAEHRPFTPEWRPFQLGFLLLTVVGVVRGGTERDLVDLVWFPTGGGKTEAYLGLAAFTIMHRRLLHRDAGAGTTVITRYTLRLLTAQQFQRAATMIAACEVIRSEAEGALGSRPVSIGIWVGGNNSPNRYAQARELIEHLRDGVAEDQSFLIETCPWCGTRIVPRDERDERVWGIHVTNNALQVRCPNGRCPFSVELPMSSVDEDLYRNPPTMLVGTVDKFARAAWSADAGAFFGSGQDPGPSLIIQDEFHLISGPLGTIVGLYEAAFDVLMQRNGVRPKVVAATATIRRADEQTRGVFGRDVALFPPAGVDAGNSYFVRTDHSSPGRAYAGVMPQGHTPLTALVHVAAAQLQAPVEIPLSPITEDAYSTLVVYHNSLRELGKTMTLAHDDIPSRIKVIARAEDRIRSLDDNTVVELTSNVPSAQIPHRLERLSREHGDAEGVAFLASTNMISVGVDVRRLGVMTVVGQPKTTAEYIQATSRVGRSAERPGIVVTIYSPAKPRDRSHYESFVPYHSTLYRSVEPSSVTPFSVPARLRALHADLVVLVRHALGLAGERDAARFRPDDRGLDEIRELFLARVARADDTEVGRVRKHLDALIGEWWEWVADGEADGGLRYSHRGRDQPRLLRRFTERGAGWPTLDSMRSVDVEVEVRVRKAGGW